MEIKISKSARQCCVSGKTFAHGDEIISLIRVQQGQFTRHDYLPQAWSSEFAEGALAVWSSRYIDPKHEEAQPAEVFSPLRKIFYDCVAQEIRSEIAVAYLAAQLLRRQKAFRLIRELDQTDGSTKSLLFVDKLNGRFVEVKDPDLSYSELARAQKELMDRLRTIEENANDQSTESQSPKHE